MTPHAEYPALESLPGLVHQQRRKVAALLRTQREERDARQQIDALLEQAGVEVVSCDTPLGPFEVRRAVAKDLHRYASITPINRS